MVMKNARRRQRVLVGLSLALALVYGLRSQSVSAQQVSYAPGVEGQVWQQLPTNGRGVDLINERPITTSPVTPTFSDPSLPGVADLWPCTVNLLGFLNVCYPSGIIGSGAGIPPDTAQNYAGRFAPCVGTQCYPSGLIGLGPAVTWAMGPCVMQDAANGIDCYPSGTPNVGPRVPAATGQLSATAAVAVDNNPLSPNAGTIYVTDKWNHRIQAFRFDGSVVTLAHPIGNGVSGAGPYTQVVGGQTFTGELLASPERILVDASGNLIVADSGNGRIAVFNAQGVLIDSMAILDAGGGQNFGLHGYAAPTGLAMTAGASWKGAANAAGSTLVVTDQYNCTVYFFDAKTLAKNGLVGGDNCAAFGTTLSFNTLGAVFGAGIDNGGHAYAADYDRNRVEIFDTTTRAVIGAFGDPSAGAVAPFALNGPGDVMVDHNGVYTETDALGTHQVARVWVADGGNQRIAVYKINFDQPTPVATFLFALNAAGDLNGYPGDLAEDTSHDPTGKILVTDSANARIQRFQVPDLAVLKVTSDAPTRTVFFDVMVPQGKDPIGVSTVTPMVCPTSANTAVTSGVVAAQPGCALAMKLGSAGTLLPGQTVSYSFQFTSSLSTATFDIYATGNLVGGVPQTTSNHASASVTNSCPTCSITPQVVVAGGALEALTPPVVPGTLYVGTHVYTAQVALRVTATSGIGLQTIQYQFISGPETQPGVHTVTVSGATASFDIPFRLHGTSVVEFWAINTDGTDIAHKQAQLSLALIPPSLIYQFGAATSSNATAPNAAGWWNKAVSVPLIFSGQITSVVPQSAGMAANPPLTSPVRFTTEGRNLAFLVTVADVFGLTATKASNDVDGQTVNVDMTAPNFVASPSITLERVTFDGAPPLTGTAAAALALAADPLLTNGGAGSGIATVAPAVALLNFPFGTTTQSFVATDVAGNAKTSNVIVKVLDTVRPVLSGPASITVNPGALGTVFSAANGFSVSDASMINAPVGVTPVAVTQSVAGTVILVANTTTLVTLTATDPSGNTGTLVVSVIAKLLTPPHFTRVPVNQTVEGGAAVDLLATAVDGLGGSLTVTSNAPAKFPLGATTVTFTAKDASNQTVTASVVITVVDTTAPVITACTAPVTLYTSPASVPNMIAGVTATDYSTFTVTQSPLAGTQYTLPTGTTSLVVPITLTVTDSSPNHNVSTCGTSLTLKKATQPPVLTQSDVTVPATGASGAIVTFAPTVVDPIDGTNHDLVSCLPKASGSVFPIGTTTETCSATDTAGLTGTVTFTVTVNHTLPVCTAAAASPAMLWPPNHKLTNVGIVGVTNVDGAFVTTKVTSIFQDEPTQGLGDGDTAIDGYIVNGAARLRAERSGLGDGRVYYISFTSTTPSGGSCTGTSTVGVPHDMAHPAVGGGAKYDSTKASTAQGDNCHGGSDHGHHDGDGCIAGHHGHYDGDNCQGRDGYDHDGDGHGGGRNGGSHHKSSDDKSGDDKSGDDGKRRGDRG